MRTCHWVLATFLLFLAAAVVHCDCEESGAGGNTYDFSDGFSCIDVISALAECGIELVDAPWSDIYDACEGEYRPYFECVAESYDPDGFCSDWLADINAQCATDEKEEDKEEENEEEEEQEEK